MLRVEDRGGPLDVLGDISMAIYFIRAKRAATEQARRRAETVNVASTPQRRDMFDRGPVMELVGVIFQLFWLSLFSGTFLLLFALTFRSLSFH
jgi:hypothetical protein